MVPLWDRIVSTATVRASLCGDLYPDGNRSESSKKTDPVDHRLETQLEPGDRVVFCSDGIIEAEGEDGWSNDGGSGDRGMRKGGKRWAQ